MMSFPYLFGGPPTFYGGRGWSVVSQWGLVEVQWQADVPVRAKTGVMCLLYDAAVGEFLVVEESVQGCTGAQATCACSHALSTSATVLSATQLLPACCASSECWLRDSIVLKRTSLSRSCRPARRRTSASPSPCRASYRPSHPGHRDVGRGRGENDLSQPTPPRGGMNACPDRCSIRLKEVEHH